MIFAEPQPVRAVRLRNTTSSTADATTAAAATTCETRRGTTGVIRLSVRSPSMKNRPTPYQRL